MKTKKVTDDIDKLIEVLPQNVQQSLSSAESRKELLEVVLDLGRLPEARYPNQVKVLGEKYLSRNDLQTIVDQIGKFGIDNRAGIEKTLHRISAIRNRQGDVVGLTCRVGRSVYGTVAMVRDLIDSGQSLLLMGRPGVGKTTALREIARVMADDLHLRVVVIDTSNEIAGDGDIPHPSIGRARRMQVSLPEQQHQVMIEAVENHMPEVIVIDEIGTELETHAARTIAERGVQLVATAHGNSISNLIKNPTLSDLVGGIQSVTLGDEEARRRRTQKTVLERASDPTFPIAVEINNQNCWSIHKNVAETVDLLLRGQNPHAQERTLGKDGQIQLVESKSLKSQANKTSKHKIFTSQENFSNKIPRNLNQDKKETFSKESYLSNTTLRIFCFGISNQRIDEAIRCRNWPAKSAKDIHEADVVLTIRNGLSQNPSLRKEAQRAHIPIHVIKSDSLHQIERAIERLIVKGQTNSTETKKHADLINDPDDDLTALEECRLALEKVVMPLGRPIELRPRSQRVLDMQADLVKRYRLHSDVFGHENQQRLRIYPP